MDPQFACLAAGAAGDKPVICVRKGSPSLGTEVTVQALKEQNYDEWVQLVSGSPDGNVFSLPEYLDALCSAAGGHFTILEVRCGGELSGGIALYERDSRYGRHISPRLLLPYNGPVLRRYATKYPSQQTSRHFKIMSGLAKALTQREYARVTLNCWSSITDLRPFLAAGWSVSPLYTYVVPIDHLDHLWGRIEQNLRRLIRRCENDGMTVLEDDDFETFYRLHSNTMARKGLLPYLPEQSFRRFFNAIRKRNLCRLFQAQLPNGSRIASQLVLLGGNHISHTVTAASDPEFQQTGVNAFIRWESFIALSKMGFDKNDLTGAGFGRVTHFKSQLGGDLHLFLVLDSPSTLRYRICGMAEAYYRKARKALQTTIRRVHLPK